VALANKELRKLIGVVEINKTYISGKDKNRHGGSRKDDLGRTGKAIVIGAIERKGNIVVRAISHADALTLTHFISVTISTKVSIIAHNDAGAYNDLLYGMRHANVNRSRKKYVVGSIHTNTD
jgi:hypothetical protein